MVTGICRYTKGEFNQAALDEVWNKGKETFKDPISPPSSGIVPLTLDAMWEDMYERNTGWVSNMRGGVGQFNGPYDNDHIGIHTDNFDSINIWLEIEEAGDGNGCSPRISKSSNTMVEIGYIRQYLLQNGVWRVGAELKNTQSPKDLGGNHPHAANAMDRKCGLDEATPDIPKPFEHFKLMETEYGVRTNNNGFIEYMPDYYYRYHCWNPGGLRPDSGASLDGVLGCAYARLVLKDPDSPIGDDRHLADFVGHIGSDIRKWSDEENKYIYIGDVGINRYKKITNDWVAMNLFSFKDNIKPANFAEFQALNPPITTTP